MCIRYYYWPQMGADPNSRGEFKRTPLWRAAFLGKAEVVPLLLEGGADPRIGGWSGTEGTWSKRAW